VADAAEVLPMFSDRPLDAPAGLRLLAEWFKVHDRECIHPHESARIREDLLRWADEYVGVRQQVSVIRSRVLDDERRQDALYEDIAELRKGIRGTS
jgi:hypothetical protein